MTPTDYARCRGRESTPAECAGCTRWHAARETLASARVPGEIMRVVWVMAPAETPCPLRDPVVHTEPVTVTREPRMPARALVGE